MIIVPSQAAVLGHSQSTRPTIGLWEQTLHVSVAASDRGAFVRVLRAGPWCQLNHQREDVPMYHNAAPRYICAGHLKSVIVSIPLVLPLVISC